MWSDLAFGPVIAAARPSVVRVAAGRGNGAGTVLGKGGFILTNAHVTCGGPLAVGAVAGAMREASLLAIDRQRDLALLVVPSLEAPALALAPRNAARPGQLLIALGHPGGEGGSARMGVIVAARDRANALGSDDCLLFSDLRLAPGFSGGPMLDTNGHVLAISTLVQDGLAAGIAVDSVRRFLAEVAAEVSNGSPPRSSADPRTRHLAG